MSRPPEKGARHTFPHGKSAWHGLRGLVLGWALVVPVGCGTGPVAVEAVEEELARPAPASRVASDAASDVAPVVASTAAPAATTREEPFHSNEAIVRVSLTASGGQGDKGSWYPTCSANGRYVVFMSSARNLVPGDTNGKTDVYVHDRATGRTALAGVGTGGKASSEGSWSCTISGDGRYVAFASRSPEIVGGDTNDHDDIFVRDLKTGVTERITTGGAAPGTRVTVWVRSISAHGRYVVFSSDVPGVVPGDTNGVRDLFVHDRRAQRTRTVSAGFSGGQSDGTSNWHDISADGRSVVFDSEATNLVPGDTNGKSDVFVHDCRTGKTVRASVSSGGGEAHGSSNRPAISGDGRFVTFQSGAPDLVPADMNGKVDVFVRDLEAGRTERVSVSSFGVEGDGGSTYPTISADGRYVLFESDAKSLVPESPGGRDYLCVHDRVTRETARVNVSAVGVPADGQTLFTWLSADGRFVSFCSSAKNLVPGDTNGHRDVFVAKNPLFKATR